ncbi:hypothetical protein M0802_012385 [Mischocyttarus mexicanus]|nr:hypothetical protein M0802_012385 [Mischocyttarus mexicanus]
MYKEAHAKVTPNLVTRKVRRHSTLSEPSTTCGTEPWNEGNDFRTPRKTAKIQKTTECPPIATGNAFTALKGASEMKQLNATTNEYSGMQSTNKAEFNDTPRRTNRSKPPPIYAILRGIKAARAFSKGKNFPDSSFTLRDFDGKMPYYGIIWILKGIRGSFDEIDVKEAISELNLKGVDIAKVQTPDKYHFIVSLKHNSLTAQLWKCKALLNQRCRWDRLKRPPIFQCRNCQRVRHASANCNLKPVCCPMIKWTTEVIQLKKKTLPELIPGHRSIKESNRCRRLKQGLLSLLTTAETTSSIVHLIAALALNNC